MIEGRLTHTRSERLFNNETYNIFCYYGYTGHRKNYENNIKHINLARDKIQHEKLITEILDGNGRKFEPNK